jgi:hypothetical protein
MATKLVVKAERGSFAQVLKLPFNWYLSINRIPVISTFSGSKLLLKTE